jgi:hypothetical protein
MPIAEDLSSPNQFKLYYKNRDQFNHVAKELTRFFCYAHIGDLLDEDGKVKYDNIPLYLDPSTNEGKVALIDLEEFSQRTPSIISSSIEIAEEAYEEDDDDELDFMFAPIKGCIARPEKSSPTFTFDPIIFQLFPLHCDEIIEELKKIYPDIENYREQCKEISEKTLKYFKKKII